MEERTQGIVLRTRPLTETSLIVHWLTADLGRVATVAKGARRPKSLFRGKLDLFYEAELTFRRSRTSELHTLAELELRQTHSRLRTDYHRLSQVAYAAALVEMTTEVDTPLMETWELFGGFLRLLAGPAEVTAGTSTAAVLAFELKHLTDLGQAPDLDRQSLSREARSLAEGLLGADWSELPALSASPSAVAALARFLHGFLIFHLGRLPRGRAEAIR